MKNNEQGDNNETDRALKILLTEYSCLREEAQHDDTHQIQLVAITFSALVAIIAAVASLQSKIQIQSNAIRFIVFILLPCLIMFLGLLWIDLIYRRTRFGSYTKILESKINWFVKESCYGKIMGWEHWIAGLEDGTGFFNTTRFFRGYIISGSWLAAPILIAGSYFLLVDNDFMDEAAVIFNLAVEYWYVSVFMIMVYCIYYLFFIKYLIKIMRLRNVDYFPQSSN